jgi:acyl-CoA thioester hydrolase
MDMNSKAPDFVDTLVTVRYAETDQMGVVYYANYLIWMEVGRAAWCHDRGFHYRDLEAQHNRMMLVAEATCRYKAPARYEDIVLIRTAAGPSSDKVIRFIYEIRKQSSGQLLATGETVHVVTDRDLRPSRLPEQFGKLFLPPSAD